MQPVTQDRRWAGQDGSAPSQGHAPASGKGGSWSRQGLPTISSRESGVFPESQDSFSTLAQATMRISCQAPANLSEPWKCWLPGLESIHYLLSEPLSVAVCSGDPSSDEVRRHRVLAFHNRARRKAHSYS